jgi:hypothetical protein
MTLERWQRKLNPSTLTEGWQGEDGDAALPGLASIAR